MQANFGLFRPIFNPTSILQRLWLRYGASILPELCRPTPLRELLDREVEGGCLCENSIPHNLSHHLVSLFVGHVLSSGLLCLSIILNGKVLVRLHVAFENYSTEGPAIPVLAGVFPGTWLRLVPGGAKLCILGLVLLGNGSIEIDDCDCKRGGIEHDVVWLQVTMNKAELMKCPNSVDCLAENLG